ncbi:DUF917 domain-containing protein [Phytoactinopolyspora endophytica]|uniref:DUF917 domain-containing protein n=1 Tax=Phytoactinopolyspora endophytica TaxID=1642495 RepID=UPI00101C8F18|nr:DUF917 domain-containing protein [Phytoactinopolyspora endophytica]
MELTEADLPALSRGCAVLGTGGGGAVDTATPSALQALRTNGPLPVRRLDELDPETLVAPMAGIGAPTVSHEMPGSLAQPLRLRDEIERQTGRRIGAIMASEIGGSNGVEPVAWASRLGVPLLDADCMGRAFPEVQMVSTVVAGRSSEGGVVMSDVVGNVSVLRPVSAVWAERQARALCVASGATSLISNHFMTAADARGAVIEGSVSRAVGIGHAVDDAEDPVAALVAHLNASHLLDGKIIDVERTTGGGFVRGSAVVEGTGSYAGRMVRIEIQNENLAVFEGGEVLASVPDLISVVDAQTADAISTEMLRYGQRVSVLAWPCDPLWRTEKGLEVVGPKAFGYDIVYRPVEELAPPRDHQRSAARSRGQRLMIMGRARVEG